MGFIAGIALGDAGEKALLAVRVRSLEGRTLCILATNSHAGGDAVRFRMVDVLNERGVVLVRDTASRQLTEAHQGNVERRLQELPGTPRGSGWIARYLADTALADTSLKQRQCTPQDHESIVKHLWPQTGANIMSGDGSLLHHPREFLLDGSLTRAHTGWDVFLTICAYIDHFSEAREPGDRTKDRTERLAFGAGDRIKRASWRWLLGST